MIQILLKLCRYISLCRPNKKEERVCAKQELREAQREFLKFLDELYNEQLRNRSKKDG